jgi:hypothetical protein
LKISDYIKDNYGLCAKDKCHCLTMGWLGRTCPNWKSSDCNTFEELSVWQKELKNEK